MIMSKIIQPNEVQNNKWKALRGMSQRRMTKPSFLRSNPLMSVQKEGDRIASSLHASE